MFEKAIEIIVQRLFPTPRPPNEIDEDQAKQRLVFLHEALCEDHAAYKTYLAESNETNYDEWIQATEWLDNAFERISLVIAVFEPQVFECIQNYLDKTILCQTLATRSDDSDIFTAVAVEKDELANCDADFLNAIKRLRIWMKDRMTPGEIFRAQEAYQRERPWFSGASQLFFYNLRHVGVLYHNPCVVIQSVHELGIETNFEAA